MGRTRTLVAVLAMIVGVTAVVVGLRSATRAPTETLAAEDVRIPEADVPAEEEATEPETTATTFDLSVLIPSTAHANSTTPAPKSATTTVGKNFATVRVTNSTLTPVKVWLRDASEHVAVLSVGEGVDWVVETAAADFDRGGASVDATLCGGKWTDANNVVGGRQYHFDIKPTAGRCANGEVMPELVITDVTVGSSKAIVGPIPDAGHALLYIVNEYSAAVKLHLTDGRAIEMTLNPAAWSAPQMLKTTTDHGDGVSVTRVDSACGVGDSGNYFLGGHTYRIVIVEGSGVCGIGKGPGLVVHDLTTVTSLALG